MITLITWKADSVVGFKFEHHFNDSRLFDEKINEAVNNESNKNKTAHQSSRGAYIVWLTAPTEKQTRDLKALATKIIEL